LRKIEDGIDAYLSGDVNSAIRILTECLEETNVPMGRVYYYLGLAYGDLGKNREAGDFLKKALELEPTNGIYHYRLALIYINLMLFRFAIPHLLETIKQNPEHVRAHFVLAETYFKNGDLEPAAFEYGKVIELSPEYAFAYFELGKSLFYTGKLVEAKSCIDKAISLSPEKHFYQKLAEIYALEGNNQAVLKYMKLAYEQGLDDLPFLYRYTLALIEAGDIEETKKIFSILEENFPAAPEIIMLRGKLNDHEKG
jgi:tetratricopeptide (TPR) repeat protein